MYQSSTITSHWLILGSTKIKKTDVLLFEIVKTSDIKRMISNEVTELICYSKRTISLKKKTED